MNLPTLRPGRSPLLTIMIQAVEKVARGIRRDFNELENLQVSKKGVDSFVTSADLRAEKILFEELSKSRPKVGFLMEEGGEIPGEEGHGRWIIDPLDGTSNFMRGYPHFCISVAYEKEGRIQAGVALDPLRSELFYAEMGQGAFLNDRRIRVAEPRNPNQTLLSFLPRKGLELEYQTSVFQNLSDHVGKIRISGSAVLDLCYIAAARLDGGLFLHVLEPWDVAVGVLMIQEAGGFITTFENQEVTFQKPLKIVAGTPAIHKKLLGIKPF